MSNHEKKLRCATLVACAGILLVAGCQESVAEAPATSIVQDETVLGGGDEEAGAALVALHEERAEHCDQEELNAVADPHERFEEAFECGDELFEARFNAVDGVGANVGNGGRFARSPRADLRGPNQWFDHEPERVTGPNAEACNHCHNDPFDDGAGAASTNVTRDPFREGNIARFIQRNTPHVFAPGAIQRLAEEMTTELQALRDAARPQSCSGSRDRDRRRRGDSRGIRVDLVAKGISFGSIIVRCDGHDDTRNVRGVAADLVVRPFQWKGTVAFLRDFNRGASHNELGMQPVETTGVGVDGDGDGVSDELVIGDQTALSVYLAAQPRPVTMAELSDLGLLDPPLTAESRSAITSGEMTFAQIGCASCHTPQLVIDDPIFSEPSQHPAYRDETFPAGIDPVSVGVDPEHPIEFDLTADQPDNVFDVNGVEVRLGAFERTPEGGAIVRLYSDLRRHDLGSGIAEAVDETGTGASTFLSETLWGVGSTAPYLHDGRATTLTEAIAEHRGEGSNARAAFLALARDRQAALIAFLDNLVLFKALEE